jgi:hypothetical protein
MAHSFKTYPGRPTFEVYKEPLNAGEYIKNKRAIATFCGANVCKPSRALNTQSNLLLLNRANYLNYYSCGDIDKKNLYINLLTTLDLSGVPVIQDNNTPFYSPTDITIGTTVYTNYIVDPSGNLFGNTTCGVNNYENYLIYNPPYKTEDPGHINNT